MFSRTAKRPAVFLAPIDICGIYSCLTRGLREIGCRADFLSLGVDKNGSWDDSDSDLPVRCFSRVHRRVADEGFRDSSWLAHNIHKIQYVLVQVWLLAWVLLTYEVFILKSGLFIGLWGFDIKLLKLFRKKVVVIFQGSDSRPPFMRPVVDGEAPEDLLRRTGETKARVDHAWSFADVIIDNPLASHNHANRCCLYQTVGIVIDEEKLQPGRVAAAANDPTDDDAVRILHAPSAPELKGTDRIRTCISDLRQKGYQIDYVEISGRPNSEVLQEIVRSDIVIDELYSDLHGAVFATEACAFGKPVIVGGYGKKHLDRFVPAPTSLPTVFVASDEFEVGLERLINDADRWNQIGDAAAVFFTDYASGGPAAERLLRIAAGEAPTEWFFDPLDVVYVEGVGAERSKIAANIAKLVDAYGPDALMLDHHPALRDAVLEFMREHRPATQLDVA
jgi:hypothetical protein